MNYFTFHIDDSGAIEDIDVIDKNDRSLLVCKMYDDEEFNQLNDILHSLNDYIVNDKALSVFKKGKTIAYELRDAKVLRKEKFLGFFRKYKTYNYYELSFPDDNANSCYDWIDFEKSDIYAKDQSGNKIKISSHQHTQDLIEINKSKSEESYDFETKKIVFNKSFDFDIDLFKIPL